jgi:hypothetical protein
MNCAFVTLGTYQPRRHRGGRSTYDRAGSVDLQDSPRYSHLNTAIGSILLARRAGT